MAKPVEAASESRETSVMNREAQIEEAIMRSPGALGYPDALAIRNCRVSMPTGRVDLVLLPHEGPVRLVLVEAKAASAPDAASKVVGQILMYYAGALSFGEKGIELLRDFALNHPERARGSAWISPKALTGISPPSKAFETLGTGTRLKPAQIALVVALDGPPHRGLSPTLGVLRSHHRLNIRCVVVQSGKVLPADPSAPGAFV